MWLIGHAARDAPDLNSIEARLGLPVAATRRSEHLHADAPGRRLLDKLVEPPLFDVAVHFLRAVVADSTAGAWAGTPAAVSTIADTLMAADLPRRVGLDPPEVRLALAAMADELLHMLTAGPLTIASGGRTIELRRAHLDHHACSQGPGVVRRRRLTRRSRTPTMVAMPPAVFVLAVLAGRRP